jgi:phosphoribosyl-dephospho-CoA transferase
MSSESPPWLVGLPSWGASHRLPRDADIYMVRPHDILQLKRGAVLEGLPQAPEWVEPSLTAVPFVTVRRAPLSSSAIPVGVRGLERSQRWASFADPSFVEKIIRPRDLLRCRALAQTGDAASAAALSQLRIVMQRWREVAYPWGPSGSVGFELATGFKCVGPSSDLDLVLYAGDPIDRGRAMSLQGSLSGGPARVDALVETPFCAFSLAEYANARSDRILLRTVDGPRLGLNPWSPELLEADQ